jgi:hypothetical protein
MDSHVIVGPTYEPYQKLIMPQGLYWSQDFKDKINNGAEEIHSKIILEINGFAGDNWSAKFSDFDSPGKNKFIVDVTAPSPEFLIRIAQVIVNSFHDLDFMFFADKECFFETSHFRFGLE